MFDSTIAGSALEAWTNPDGDELDRLLEELTSLERVVSKARSCQAEIVAKLDAHQIDLADGARNMRDWISAELDCGTQLASRLRQVAAAGADIRAKLATGTWSLDRAALLARLRDVGASDQQFSEAADRYSLGRIYGLIEQLRRQDPKDESDAYADRYLVFQPDLENGVWRHWGQMPAADGETVLNALQAREGEFPALPDQGAGQRLSDALVSICMDSLAGDQAGGGRVVTGAEVFINAQATADADGEAGAVFSSGLKAGPNVLSEILCEGKVRVIGIHGGRPVVTTDSSEAIPQAVRSFVQFRDQGRCSIEGCRSRYRLQIHHIRERSRGGNHDPSNLILLCWYHHHVAVHGLGMKVDPDSPPDRRRLLGWRSRPPPGSPGWTDEYRIPISRLISAPAA
ncbi:MAG TPA: HNH endonuclease signature motif containing protein [Acidimicrobiia bacterium]